MAETEIELFRAGGKASRGITPEILAEVAAFDPGEKGVPFCFGHPKSDTPAAGSFKKLRAEGNRLFGTIGTLTAKAREGIAGGEWLDRSMAFFDPTHEANPTPGKWAPRHVGLLGAAAPGIPGMAPLKQAFAFDADGGLIAEGAPADAVIYAAAPTPTHLIFDAPKGTTVPVELTDEQKAQQDELDRRQREADERDQQFAARERSARETFNATLIDGLVRENKVLPAEVPALKLVFNALGGDELEFSADAAKPDKAVAAVKLAAFISGAVGNRVPTGKTPISPSGEFAASEGASPDELTAKARELMKTKTWLTFEAAIGEVSGEAA